MNEYLRRIILPDDALSSWSMWHEDGDILVIPGGHRWRIERTPTVGDLVKAGDIVTTNYDTGGLVIGVRSYQRCCCPLRDLSRSRLCEDSWELPAATQAYHRLVTYWTITYVLKSAKQTKDGRFYDKDHFCYLGEFVAVGSRVLKLYEANPDEVFVLTGQDARFAIPAQLPLL